MVAALSRTDTPLTRRSLRGLGGVVCLALLLAGACGRDDGPGADLRSAIESASEPVRFAFDYRAGGTRVNDCFLPNRSFSGLVDRESGVLALHRDGEPEPGAYVAQGNIYLRATLFADGVAQAPWLQARGPLDAAHRAAVVGAVGDGFAGYVASGLLPPDGNETALALVEAAREVRRTAVSAENASYVLDVPAEALGAAGDTAGAEARDVLAEVMVSGGRVTRISIDEADEPVPADAEHNENEGPLWVIDYRPSADRVELPAVDGVEELTGLDPARLRPAAIAQCEVPL